MNSNRVHSAASDNQLFHKIQLRDKESSRDTEKKDEITIKGFPECVLLKHPNTFLRFFGLYHRKDDHFIKKIYPLSLIFIDVLNFARSLTTYKSSESLSAELGLKILFTIWSFICASSAIILFINHERTSREQNLMANISSMIELKITDCKIKKLKIFVYASFFIGFSMAFFNILGVMIAFFGPSSFSKGFNMFLAPFNDVENIANNVGYKILILILIGVSSFHWMLSLSLYASHSLIIVMMLHNFNHNFEEFVKKSILVSHESGNLSNYVNSKQEENIYIENKQKMCVCEKSFEKHRILHLKLSYLVQLLDECYTEYIGICVTLYIIIVLVLLYIMSDWSGNCISGITAILYPFWFLVSFVVLSTIVVLGAIINSKVKIELFTCIFNFLLN